MAKIIYYDRRVLRLQADKKLVQEFDKEYGYFTEELSYPEKVRMYRDLIYRLNGKAEVISFPVGFSLAIEV